MDSITNCLFYTSLFIYLYLFFKKITNFDILNDSFFILGYILVCAFNFLDFNNSRAKLFVSISMWAIILSIWENESYKYSNYTFEEKFDKISYILTDIDEFSYFLYERPLWIVGIIGITLSVFFNKFEFEEITEFIAQFQDPIKITYQSIITLTFIFTIILYLIIDPENLKNETNIYYISLWTIIIQISGLIYTSLIMFDENKLDKYTNILTLTIITTILYNLIPLLDAYISTIKDNVYIENMRFIISTLVYTQYMFIVMTLYTEEPKTLYTEEPKTLKN